MKKSAFALVAVLVVCIGVVACGGRGGAQRTIIQNKGSDTLLDVAQAWAEAYRAVSPNVSVAVTGGGSGTGISAIINGTVDVANSSRQIRDSEIEQATANGSQPQEFIVGYDALAVFLHPNNPIDSVSYAQLAEIYGENGQTVTWSQLGVSVPGCPSDEIIRVSRQNNSGTYEYFRESILGDGDYKLGSRDMHGSKDVVELVGNTPCAIGYSGLAYADEHVTMPCVMVDENGACVAPTVATAIDRTYPIARPLYMYTRNAPEGAVKDYLDWILSDAGQCIIQQRGYAPVRNLSCDG